MLADHCKEIVRNLFAAQLAGDFNAVADLLHDDLIWRYMGSGPQDASHSKAAMLTMGKHLFQNVISTWERDVVGMVAEGDKVAVEAINRMMMKDGREYRQRYHYLFEIRDGRILAVREYLDTAAARQFFSGAFPGLE